MMAATSRSPPPPVGAHLDAFAGRGAAGAGAGSATMAAAPSSTSTESDPLADARLFFNYYNSNGHADDPAETHAGAHPAAATTASANSSVSDLILQRQQHAHPQQYRTSPAPSFSSSNRPFVRSPTLDERFYSASPFGAAQPSRVASPPAQQQQQQFYSAATASMSMAFAPQWSAPEPIRSPEARVNPGALYSQPNYSSPSFSRPGAGSHPTLDTSGAPPVPSLDDLNVRLEGMRFEQQPPSQYQQQGAYGYGRMSPRHASVGSERGGTPASIPAPGQDGAMQIVSPNGGLGAGDGGVSVYSIDSATGAPARTTSAGVMSPSSPSRRESSSSARTFASGASGIYGAPGSGSLRHRLSEQSVGERAITPGGGGGSSSGEQHQQQYYGAHPSQQPKSSMPQSPTLQSGFASYGDAESVPGFQLAPSSARTSLSGSITGVQPLAQSQGSSGHQTPIMPQQGFGQWGDNASYGAGQSHFQPQPPHASGWGHDYRQAQQAQNPYYAAATGTLAGYYDSLPSQSPYSLHRAVSSGSSLQGMTQRSSSSLAMHPPGVPAVAGNGAYPAVPPGTGMPGRQPPRRSQTDSLASTGSGGRKSNDRTRGPPITKASVDEYRARVKADPDPEAQFMFAKYLIEAAKKISTSTSGDEKAAKKYRDALLSESLKLIKRLATQGVGLGKPAYADAQFFLANCLGNGSLGLAIDHEKAYNLYVQASKQNHSAATYRTAVCNEIGVGTRRDHARAVLFYRKASALGDTPGMYKLGVILLNGLLGQQRNVKEAIAWLKRAAAQADEDNPHALHELAQLYEKAPPAQHPLNPHQQPSPFGNWISNDPMQALELFTQAAHLGYPPSQLRLAQCYQSGLFGCPVDPRRSIFWFTRAAERGDAQAELALSGWYLTGSDGVLKQSDSEAYLWARRAANKGLAKAEYGVGYYSEVGIGVRADIEEARRWYMRAAAQGDKKALQRLTELKMTKHGQRVGGKAGARPTRQEASSECLIS